MGDLSMTTNTTEQTLCLQAAFDLQNYADLVIFSSGAYSQYEINDDINVQSVIIELVSRADCFISYLLYLAIELRIRVIRHR